jgi:hypothetical protein
MHKTFTTVSIHNTTGKSAEAVPCCLSSLVGSTSIFTSGHYTVGDGGGGGGFR